MTDTRDLSSLRPHPENAAIFGDPEESEQFDGILASIKANGIWEPLVIKADGTILSGHLRRIVATKLKLKTVPVRVVPEFASYRDEVAFVIRSNTDRRQLSKGEIAIAFKRLREIPQTEGGAKKKRGRPEGSVGSKNNPGIKPGISETRDDAAEMLGVSTDEARALETVFTTPGVPEALKAAVNSGAVAPTPAAKAVKTEQKRQGGKITDQAALVAAATPKKKATTPANDTSHEQRMAREAESYRTDYKSLHELYSKLDAILTRRALKSVLGPTEHHEYAALIRDCALRAWREIESVQGPTNAGKQMSLSVISGGRS